MQKIKADKEQQNLKRKETVGALETTATDGSKTTILLGSDGDHVEMKTGRTLEQEYMGVLKTMGKEYVSTDGADITVNNGVEARLIGAEIQGNTKRLDANGNECEAGTEGARLVSTEACISNNGIKYPFYQQYIEGETVVQKRTKGSQNAWATIPNDETRDTVANEYRLYSPSGAGSVPSVTDTVDLASGVKVENTKEIVLDNRSKFSDISKLTNTTRVKYDLEFIGKENTLCLCNNLVSIVKFNEDSEHIYIADVTNKCWIFIDNSKLSSKTVIDYLIENPITIRYQLTTPTTTQLTKEQLQAYTPYKKQILLYKVGDVADKFESKEDGSGIWSSNIAVEKITMASQLSAYTAGNSANHTCYVGGGINGTQGSMLLCNVLPWITGGYISSVDRACVSMSNSNGQNMFIKIPNTISIEDFIAQNEIIIYYSKITPTTTYIPKSVNEAIATTDKINIFSVGEAVKASSFSVNVPINTMDELNALKSEVDEIKAIISSKRNLDLLGNYIDDQYDACIAEIN